MKSVYKDIINDPSIKHVMTQEELAEIHTCLINMLKEIINACENNDITPFLIYGNLLGKVRHNGFIPWDDDLDIGMLRKDYDKFVKIFRTELQDKYYISAPNSNGKSYYRFVQVGRKGTIRVVNNLGPVDEQCPTSHCFIDIFPFDYSPDNVLIRKCKGFWCELRMLIAGCVDFDIKCKTPGEIALFKSSVRGKIELFSRIMIHKIFAFRSASDWYHALDKSIQSKPSHHLVCSLGKDYYHGAIYNIQDILPLKKVEFYGINIGVPSNSDKYLKKCYGNYMELPPVEKRQCHSASRIIIDKDIFA